MKTRTAFVSNSSTSSFCLIGRLAGRLSLYDAVFIGYDGYSGLIDGGQISGDQSYVVMYGDADQNSSDADTLLENIKNYED